MARTPPFPLNPFAHVERVQPKSNYVDLGFGDISQDLCRLNLLGDCFRDAFFGSSSRTQPSRSRATPLPLYTSIHSWIETQ